MNIDKLLKIVRFCISGGVGVSFGYITLYSLTEYIGLWYLFSSIITLILTDILGFVIKKFWVFENRDIKRTQYQIFLYLILSVIYSITNTGLLFILVEYLPIHYILSQVILMSVLSIASYILSKRIFIAQKIQ